MNSRQYSESHDLSPLIFSDTKQNKENFILEPPKDEHTKEDIITIHNRNAALLFEDDSPAPSISGNRQRESNLSAKI